MAFKMKAARSGAGTRKTKLSIAAAPYQVKFKDGGSTFCGNLREVVDSIEKRTAASVYDRHEKAYLDIETLRICRKRKFISGPSSEGSNPVPQPFPIVSP